MTDIIGLILLGTLIVGVILSDYFDYLKCKEFFKSINDNK